MKYQNSYKEHARLEKMQAGADCMPSCFSASDTVDAWRHRRMHEMLTPILDQDPVTKWMTVGDGSYGSDAYYLHQKGIDVLASSLTDHSLKLSQEKGYLKKIAAVNAEEIPYEDETFDFVLCKEAYHHFPRPAVAFYEMLRVAKKAVILIEPYEGPKRLLDIVKEPMKRLLWGKDQTIHFEPSGNYIYRISPKQIGKKLAAIGYSTVVYRNFNDIFLPQFGGARCGSIGHVLTKLIIVVQDMLCTLRLMNPALTVVISFKENPSWPLRQTLKRSGYSILDLPKNPYTQSG